MARVGLLTFSDGRDFVHADIKAFSLDVESRITEALEQAGHEVIRAAEPIWTNTMATTEARRVADARPDLTIFNYAVWAFPHFSMLAAAASPGPLLLFSNIDPQFPGMVGMLAAGGGLDQIGRAHTRVWVTWPTRRCGTEFWRRSGPPLPCRPCRAVPSAGSAAARWGCTPRWRTPISG